MQLIIGDKNYSSWSLRPWLLIKYFDLVFEEVNIPLYSPESPTLIKQHCPVQKVPVLNDKNLTIWDSLAICEYINDIYLNGKAYPNDIKQRFLAKSLVAEMHSSFINIRTQMSMDIRANNKEYNKNCIELTREIERIDTIFANAKGEFLCGDFCIVDCFFAPIVFRFRTFNVKLSDKSQQYQKRLLTLPAMQQWEYEALKEEVIFSKLE
ncbi:MULTISPECIES: glutathione S-transferase family protein [Pasteurellaceae]|uniref:Glutathione S-transferase family protein n=1 Tax=Pasteurella atlantica TaxID=2827233 RepID=A0AAW8CH63_9PAST|nr:glutathione S-transferase family protein [Pasteurella atlantica]MBR0574358.1 glutathione S-transferase family protein [Pasteurella atlantica]MDP8040259.1 glutathione S-transferase family protein [Pasteurella atlantica]MDP8042375.1 glutathione S-transferase family protein [Pasteurella atlantica]MDP8044565.1 glutathione S-transferase family protein [Pasteurella atlantica]MDP8046580.1 glutathione S-transferase family protein [Pasteurella atlantica]